MRIHEKHTIVVFILAGVAVAGCDDDRATLTPTSKPAASVVDTGPVNPELKQDDDIEAAVQRELNRDRLLSRSTISVDVKAGIAQIRGTADSLLAKERASYIAEAVLGVRSVISSVEIKPAKRTDSGLEQAVTEALRLDPAADAYELDVSCEAGVVTLEGKVESLAEKMHSLHVAKGVRGVRAVNGTPIRVAVEPRSDIEIREDVEARIRWDVLVNHSRVAVGVHDGVVELSGTVGSAAEARHVRSLAWIQGVKEVDIDSLLVNPWFDKKLLRKGKFGDVPDDVIDDAILRAALYDPRVAGFGFRANVVDGKVTLKGEVPSLLARDVAESIARHTVGVIAVDNQIEVRQTGIRPDVAVAKDVGFLLQNNYAIDATNMKVGVDEGVVTLRGKAASNYEKAIARDAAASVAGVVKIDNQLEVEGKPEVLAHDAWRYTLSPMLDEPVVIAADPLADDPLEKAVKEELMWDVLTSASGIDVDTSGGIVTLKGEVDSWQEYAAAERNAYQAGAVKVVNDLEIRR